MKMYAETRSRWSGVLAEKRFDQPVELHMEALLQSQSDSRGGALPFKVLASDERVYWVKMALNPQSNRVPVTEQVIAGAGRLIGAPVCDTALIYIPEAFDGDKLDNGTTLHSCIAHASLDVGNCAFNKSIEPEHRTQDDNRRRHAAYFAFYEWCWGDDMQWLYDRNDNRRTYSHDHGHFLPGAPNWTPEKLEEFANCDHEIGVPGYGLDDNELRRIAGRLQEMKMDELEEVLALVPPSWPVSNGELEGLGAFLDYRRANVTNRLLSLAANLSEGK